jgi:outer membrane protein OmpA-like peptidoglycan-associated protein
MEGHMRTTRGVAGLLALVMASGCATLKANPTVCRWTSVAIGGAVGAGAGAGATSTLDLSDDDEAGGIAAGAVGGFVLGALAGAVAGYFLCHEPPAEPAPPPPPAPEPPPAAGTKIETLAGPHFAFDRAELTPEGRARVDRAVGVLRQHPTLGVLVVGYTDSIGSDAYNLRLSERRAGAVRDHMVAQGIEAGRIEASGRGKADPVADNATPEGRAQNRRVEITAR